MSHLVSEAFDILEPDFPSALFSPSAIAGLRSVIPVLAPVCGIQLGFECRLNDDSRVDLLQCLIASRGHIQTFRQTINSTSANENAVSDAVWERIQILCARWCEGGSFLSKSLQDLWLEFDVEAAYESRPRPSLFVGLHPDLHDWEQRFLAAKDVLTTLNAEAISHSALKDNLGHCFKVCAGRASLSHVGVMLARPIPVVRVCVQGLKLSEIPVFLLDVEWPGDLTQVKNLLETAGPMIDEIHLILDVGENCVTYPRLGLECFIALSETSVAKWGTFSQWLVEQGLCSAAKRADLLDWHRPLTPPQTPLPWPEILIAESLLHSPEKLMILDRQINHIKLDLLSPQRLEAKAYLGAGREWRTVSGQ
jgi:hypothetical protein